MTAKKDDALAKANELLPQLTIKDVQERYAKGASESEFALFLDQIKVNKLDPRKREVYFVKYGNNPGQIITGYQVYLQKAEATGRLDGWDIQTSVDNSGKIISATLTIYRKDWDKPFSWTVEADEFDKGQATWKSMKSFMLKKVCIAQGFRMCFPDEVSGLPYTTEEVTTFADAKTAAAAVEKSGDPGRTIDVPPEEVEVDKPKAKPKATPKPPKKNEKKEEIPEAPNPGAEDPENKSEGELDEQDNEPEPPIDEAVRKKVLGAFTQFGVTEEIIAEVIGKDFDKMTESDRTHLLAQYHKLKDNEITIDEFKESNK